MSIVAVMVHGLLVLLKEVSQLWHQVINPKCLANFRQELLHKMLEQQTHML
jgi:hypothetical protein